MGADIKNLKTRIKSVDSTLHLTKAMGLVASSKIRRANDAMLKGRAYLSAFENVIDLLTSVSECQKSPYMQASGTRTRIIVIAGDRGLAGGYNANVFKLAKNIEGAEFIPIGKRACDRFSRSAVYVENFSTEDALNLSKKLCLEFCNGDFDRLGIIGTKYISVMTQEPFIRYILPLTKNDSTPNVSAIFEPDELTILNTAVPEYIAGVISVYAKESFASEVAARRVAMDAAGKNAKQMIDDLQLSYNRARQSTITQEITEIVAGSNS